MGFQLQQKSMILNDLERGRYGRLLSVALTYCLIKHTQLLMPQFKSLMYIGNSIGDYFVFSICCYFFFM